MQAALELLAHDGLGAVTTRNIAGRIGLTEGALFRHFESKQAILVASLDHLESQLFEPMQGPPEQDPLVLLERFFRRRVELVSGPTALGHLVFSEQLVHATGEIGRQRIRAWRARSAGFVRTCLDALAAAGRLRHGLTADALVSVVQGQVLGFVVERAIVDPSEPTLETRIDEAWATLRLLILEPDGR